jgi:hypothetical protein
MPDTDSTAARPAPRFLTLTVARELGILLALSVLFPFMVHLIPVPEDARLGQRLLPMFYAPLLGVLWGRPRLALVVALLAPWLNWLLTRHPSPPSAALMSLELLVFVLGVSTLLARLGPRWFLPLPAYAAGKAATVIAAALLPALIGGRPLVAWVANALVQGLPGLAILVVLTLLVLRFYPPNSSGHGPATA